MPVSADTLRLLMGAGVTGDALIEIVASIDRDMLMMSPAQQMQPREKTARQERNARYYARVSSEKRLKASEQDVLSDDSDVLGPPLPEEKRKVSPCTPSKEKTQTLSTISPRTPMGSDTPHPDSGSVRDEVRLAFDAYNATAARAGWPQAQALNPTRKAALKARLADAGGIEGWRNAMAKAEGVAFFAGDNDRGWRADLNFFLQAKSFTRLMEGAYDRSSRNRKPSGAHADLIAGFAAVAAQYDDRGGFFDEAGAPSPGEEDFRGPTIDLAAGRGGTQGFADPWPDGRDVGGYFAPSRRFPGH